jgi:hypothetical protein
MCNNLELAWAAGFFDGEGCITLNTKGKKFQASIAQVDREVLDRFKSAVEIGNVTGPYDYNKPNKRPFYTWHTNGVDNITILKDKIGPFLSSIKRDQFIQKLIFKEQWLKGEHERRVLGSLNGWIKRKNSVLQDVK